MPGLGMEHCGGAFRMEKLKPLLIPGIFSLILLALALVTGLAQEPDGDETHFHIPAVEQYSQQFPNIDLQNYHSASGPVPYIWWTLLGKLVGTELSALRALTLCFGIAALFFFANLVRKENWRLQLVAVGGLAFQPYFLGRSLSLYTMIPALCLGIFSLWCFQAFQKEKRVLWLVTYVIAASLAVWSRQIYLSYVAGILAFVAVENIMNASALSLRQLAAKLLPLTIPGLALGVLFLIWGGTNPPGFRENASQGINILQLDFIPIFLGFWFVPVFFDHLDRFPKWLLALALVLSLHLLAMPLYVLDASGPSMAQGNIAGFIAKLFTVAQNKGVPILALKGGQMVLWTMGLCVLALLVQDFRKLTSLIAFAHFGIIGLVPQVWERFFLPLAPVLWLGFLPRMRRLWLYFLWMGAQALLALAYVLDKT